MSKTVESDYLVTDSGYYILIALLEPNHGYGIMKYIEDVTDGEFVIGPATLYTTLKKMQKGELIVPIGESEDRKKMYQLTEIGKQIIINEINRRIKMAELGKVALKHMEEVN